MKLCMKRHRFLTWDRLVAFASALLVSLSPSPAAADSGEIEITARTQTNSVSNSRFRFTTAEGSLYAVAVNGLIPTPGRTDDAGSSLLAVPSASTKNLSLGPIERRGLLYRTHRPHGVSSERLFENTGVRVDGGLEPVPLRGIFVHVDNDLYGVGAYRRPDKGAVVSAHLAPIHNRGARAELLFSASKPTPHDETEMPWLQVTRPAYGPLFHAAVALAVHFPVSRFGLTAVASTGPASVAGAAGVAGYELSTDYVEADILVAYTGPTYRDPYGKPVTTAAKSRGRIAVGPWGLLTVTCSGMFSVEIPETLHPFRFKRTAESTAGIEIDGERFGHQFSADHTVEVDGARDASWELQSTSTVEVSLFRITTELEWDDGEYSLGADGEAELGPIDLGLCCRLSADDGWWAYDADASAEWRREPFTARAKLGVEDASLGAPDPASSRERLRDLLMGRLELTFTKAVADEAGASGTERDAREPGVSQAR